MSHSGPDRDESTCDLGASNMDCSPLGAGTYESENRMGNMLFPKPTLTIKVCPPERRAVPGSGATFACDGRLLIADGRRLLATGGRVLAAGGGCGRCWPLAVVCPLPHASSRFMAAGC